MNLALVSYTSTGNFHVFVQFRCTVKIKTGKNNDTLIILLVQTSFRNLLKTVLLSLTTSYYGVDV